MQELSRKFRITRKLPANDAVAVEDVGAPKEKPLPKDPRPLVLAAVGAVVAVGSEVTLALSVSFPVPSLKPAELVAAVEL